MYKLIIVDDEKIIRDTIIDNFNREEMSIFNVFEASDGEDALELIREVQPNIVITDIKMPVIDGLMLSSIIKKEFEDIVIIVLSGFNDFELVRNALCIGVLDYLLKPIKEEELDSVIKKAVEVVEKNKYLKSRDNILQERINVGDLAIKQNIMNDLIMNNYSSADPFYIRATEYKFDIVFNNFFAAVFSLNLGDTENCELKKVDIELIKFSINNVIHECCVNHCKKYEFFSARDNEFVLILDDLKNNSEVSSRILNIIKDIVKKIFKLDMFFGISKNYHRITSLKSAYDDAREKLLVNIFLGRNALDFSDYMANDYQTAVFEQKEKELANSIYLCDSKKTNELIEEIFDLEAKMQLSLKQLRIININIINCIAEVQKGLKFNNVYITEDNKNLYSKIDEIKSIEEFKDFVRKISNNLIDVINKRKTSKKKKTIKNILDYIDEHFSENLTLQSIADEFFMDYTNLSKMFKEDVGKLFSKYLIEKRIEKARILLRDSNEKIYEISELVGYTDVRYFTKLFKEFEGITPLEYRKKKGVIIEEEAG